MILGMTTLTFLHVVISLIGIASGLIVGLGLLSGKPMDGLTALFLLTTLLTSITGFMFPYHGFLPSYAVGAISVVVLLIAIFARYSRHLARGWRKTYAITAMIALYLNVFVLVVQLFLKVPALHAMAPTGSEPPFKISQLIVLLLFVAWTVLGAKNFRAEAGEPA